MGPAMRFKVNTYLEIQPWTALGPEAECPLAVAEPAKSRHAMDHCDHGEFTAVVANRRCRASLVIADARSKPSEVAAWLGSTAFSRGSGARAVRRLLARR